MTHAANLEARRGFTLGIDARPWGTRAALIEGGEIIEVFDLDDSAANETSMVSRKIASAVARIDNHVDHDSDSSRLTEIRLACLPSTNVSYEVARLERHLPDVTVEVVEVGDALTRRSRDDYVATDGRRLTSNEVSAMTACGAALAAGADSNLLVPDVAMLSSADQLPAQTAATPTPFDPTPAQTQPQTLDAPYQATGRVRGLVGAALVAIVATLGLSGLLGTSSQVERNEPKAPYPTNAVASVVGGLASSVAPTITSPATTTVVVEEVEETSGVEPVDGEGDEVTEPSPPTSFVLDLSGFDFGSLADGDNNEDEQAEQDEAESGPPSKLTDIFAGLEIDTE